MSNAAIALALSKWRESNRLIVLKKVVEAEKAAAITAERELQHCVQRTRMVKRVLYKFQNRLTTLSWNRWGSFWT